MRLIKLVYNFRRLLQSFLKSSDQNPPNVNVKGVFSTIFSCLCSVKDYQCKKKKSQSITNLNSLDNGENWWSVYMIYFQRVGML